MIDLPPGIQTCLFDLDGVLTRTAAVHAAAWKEMFDAFLRERAEREGVPFVPFDEGADYAKYVDGRPRLAGVTTFLDARGIVRDPEVDRELADRKNVLVLGLIRERGVEVFEGSVRFLRAAEKAGYRRAVVSSSANAGQVLDVTGLAPLIEVLIDGTVAERDGLKGKPAPDTFLAGAKALGAAPANCAVFEDALAGVAAGAAGGFGLVVGVDRLDQAQALADAGAHVVVRDLDELLRTG